MVRSVASLVWDSLKACAAQELTRINSGESPTHTVDGEGPIGCLAEASNACLPFLVRCHQAPLHDSPTPTPSALPDPVHMFSIISSQFQELCSSNSWHVRGLALEPLYSLRNAVDDFAPIEEPLETALVEHFFAVRRRIRAGWSCAEALRSSFSQFRRSQSAR